MDWIHDCPHQAGDELLLVEFVKENMCWPMDGNEYEEGNKVKLKLSVSNNVLFINRRKELEPWL